MIVVVTQVAVDCAGLINFLCNLMNPAF